MNEEVGPKTDDAGMLITVEGIDGTGKTTQVRMLCAALANAGEDVVCSHEPTDGPWGKQLRESASAGRLSPEEELRYFIEDRKEHVATLINPAIDAGKIVVLDRYYHSTIAYQGPRGHDIEQVSRQQQELFPIPDITFLLDVSTEVALDRISGSRGEVPNKFERRSTLAAVREVFLTIAANDKSVVKLDATQPVKQLHETILQTLKDRTLKQNRCAKPNGCDDPLLCSYRQSNTCKWARLLETLKPVDVSIGP